MKAVILAHVRKNPGQTCAEIAKALEELPPVVSAILRVLRLEGALEKRGETRGARWWRRS